LLPAGVTFPVGKPVIQQDQVGIYLG
jgi:hypothetical protein